MAALDEKLFVGLSSKPHEDSIMEKLTLAAVALALLAATIVPVLVAQPRSSAAVTGRNADLAAKQQAMIDAAQRALAGFTGEESPLSPNETYVWSTHLRSAQVRAADSRQEATKACQDHLNRMQKLHRRVASLGAEGVPGGEHHKVAAAEFYLAEAEVLVLEAKGNENVRP
jgi:hypothetical protein